MRITFNRSVYEVFCDQDPKLSVQHSAGGTFAIRRDGKTMLEMRVVKSPTDSDIIGWGLAYKMAEQYAEVAENDAQLAQS